MYKLIVLLVVLFVTTLSFARTENVSDASITSAVQNKLASDSSLYNKMIRVTTSEGVVILAGTVDSDTEAAMSIELAQSVEGVKDVDATHLKVKGSNQPFTDSFITAKVKGMFIQEKLFGDRDVAAMGITVETNDGIVSLGGTADTKEQAENAVKIARSVSGVKGVKSSIRISPAGKTNMPSNR